MSYELKALKHSPQGLWMMDDTTPLQEYSPYNRNGTTTGTVGQHPAVCSSALYASILGKGATALYDAPVFIQGKEAQPFAIEAWAKSIARTKGLTAMQPYRENLCKNPSMEVDTAGWSSGGGVGTTLTRDTTNKVTGNWSLKCAGNAVGNFTLNAAGSAINNTVVKTYTLSAWVFIPTTASVTNVFLNIWSSNGGVQTGNLNSATTSVKNVWTKLTVTNTSSATGTINFGMGGTAGVTNDAFYMDSILIEEAATSLPYFDGSMVGYQWSGTAHNSISKVVTNISNLNFQLNPDFDNNVTNFVVIGSGGSAYSRVATGGYDNGPFMRATASSIGQGLGGGVMTSDLPEGVYYFSFWARSSVGISSGRFYLEGTSAPTALQANKNDNVAVPANTWYNFRGKITTNRPGNLKPGLNYGNATVAGQTVDYDGFILSTDPTYAYFDGDSAGAVWNGTVGNSESLMLVSDGEQQVLGNPGQMDGITVNGTVVSFVTKYTTSGECRVSYDLQRNHRFYAVGLHNKEKNSLFINGELVGETNLTDAQKADTYTSASSQLASGDTVSGRGLAINAVAAYAGTISPSIIRAHWDYGSTYTTPEAAVTPFGGVNVPLDKSYMNRFLDITWTNDEDFFTGLLNGLVVRDGLRPDSDTGVSLPGNWVTAIPLDPVPQTSIYGATIEWLGQGFVVETSQDGITWTTATNGAPLSTVPNNSDPTDDILNIRVTFPGGITNDTSVMSYLNVTGFSSSSYQSILQTPQSLTYPAMPDTAHDPIDYHDDYGLSLNGGSLTVTPGDPYRTIEVWLKPESAGITYNITPTTGYENGTAGIALAAGEWSLLHLTFNSDQTTPVTFSGTGQIGIVSVYPLQLTASQVSDVYASYTGRPVIRVVDSNAIAMVEPASPVLSYAYDWAITAAGR